ncbi:hypothetical protein Micbo1qcDRAFT_159245 [Microdochium bolleyi]|uniref:Tim44-like domain-containing protein n=1 Tax=Microdochium bolleyi TaxID=196109 RepID=A0A136JAJ9_9PEZI|nr:hypothetical protein Micbo1qcDRAFT_159245 [Microdochium bolleyi]
MAELMRLSRPWLQASLRAPTLARSFTTTTSARAAKPKASRDQMAMMKQPTFLVPGTLVTPPLRDFPKSPRDFFHFLWVIFKTRLATTGANVGAKIMSRDGFWGKTKLNLGRSQAVPTAKALHVQMSEAVAAGDAETLRTICYPELAERLIGQIQRRPRGIRYEWQLAKYNSTVSFPRLADFRAVTMPAAAGGQNQLVKQAVVSIASTQTIARYDDNNAGQLVPGSQRTLELIEHVVLQSNVNMATWIATPWKIWGTISHSTYQDYLDEQEGVLTLQKRNAKPR